MIRVGLTGGIATGKSTVARMFAERGAAVLDADEMVRELQYSGTQYLNPSLRPSEVSSCKMTGPSIGNH